MIMTRFTGLVVKTMGVTVNAPVGITLTYDTDDNPLAVQMLIDVPNEGEVAWYFARDLLIRGINSPTPVGQGDVKLRYEKGTLLMCLKNATGHADINLPHDVVAGFLELTLNELPASGEECPVEMIDEAIAEILGEAGE